MYWKKLVANDELKGVVQADVGEDIVRDGQQWKALKRR